MITLKRTIAAVAVGAAIAMSGVLPGSAAPMSGAAPTSVSPDGQSAGQTNDNGVTLVRRHGGGNKWRGGGGRRHAYNGGGRRHWGGGHRRYRNRGLYLAPFVAAPFLYGGYNYGYPYYNYGGYSGYNGYGNSCYQECRYEHGPRYCRKYWRRYC